MPLLGRTIRLTPAANPPTVRFLKMPPFVQLWIWVSAFATLAGWALSAVGQLNRAGYALAFAAFAIFIFFARKNLAGPGNFRAKKIFHRLRHPLPLSFFTLAVLIFIGGMIYPPTNFMALTYHIPRVLQWLAAGRWYWIHTSVVRMNYTGCDFEWLFAPLLLFTKSDRAIFLLNFFSFLMLPGLVFSVFTRFGVHPRVARAWMWLLPTGYIFLLQAGSADNDAISAFYALAAIDFALRAGKSGRGQGGLSDLWHSILATALLTGTKPVSLPLLLPWLILVWPRLHLLWRHWLPTLAVLGVAIIASFFPIALMNKLHCGDWMGTSIEPTSVDLHNPLLGIAGNGFELLQDNLAPPLFPVAQKWDNEVARFIPSNWIKDFQGGFFTTGELPTEDWAGVGFGVTGLLLISAIAGLFIHDPRPGSTPRFTPLIFARVSPWLALLAYCAKAGMATPARLIAPYYPLLFPSLLAGAAQAQIIRRPWWRLIAGIVVFLAFVVLAVSPDRPLWPAKTILSALSARHPQSREISRAWNVYDIYSKRADPLASVRALLPPDVKVVGFVAGADDSDFSLWLPLGERRVKHFLLSDSTAHFHQEDVNYVVVGGWYLQRSGLTIDEWLKQSGARLVANTNVTLKVSEGPQPWFVVQFAS